MTVLRAYKITHDSGFAPNPYAGCLTLATCKPGIRRVHQIGAWLAGFTSQRLNGDMPDAERLIYLALVSHKMELKDYYRQYPQKRPGGCPNPDNIYKWEQGQYRIPADLRPAIPLRQSAYGSITKGQAADNFIAWVKGQAAKLYPGKRGQFAPPHAPADKDGNNDREAGKGLAAKNKSQAQGGCS
jgi:hypothetical protein